MKIINLTELQFKNYSKLHSSRNYFQTVEYANSKPNYKKVFLGLVSENDDTLMGAALLLEKKIGAFKIGYVPGGFLIDYDNDDLFKDFITLIRDFLKKQKYVYLVTDNLSTYKMFNKKREVIYFDTNIIKLLDDLDFIKTSKKVRRKVVLETKNTPNETYTMFNSNTKRNIKLALERAITIYKDETNNIENLVKFTNKDASYYKSIIDNFNTDNNTAEIYLAKIDPEKYINNYRFLLKKEDEKNDELNMIMQDVSVNKSISFINKKMLSDKRITKYNNEIIKATNIYTKYPDGAIIGAILVIKNNREIYFLNEGYNKDLASFYSSHLLKWEIKINFILQQSWRQNLHMNLS